MDVVKFGRTHLEDAVPLTVGQEWSGWAGQLRNALKAVDFSREGLLELAVGGTAVGTGLTHRRTRFRGLCCPPPKRGVVRSVCLSIAS
ncbi:hypothetical protein I8920_05505 [Curtobacterium sp. YC1]|nr:hypothetical protein I8920_05505 [Curtobacterium sp. YC1]